MDIKSPPDITVFNIADWFLARAKDEGRDLKLLKLHRLVYFAYGWYCAYYDDPPLFKENFYAWRRGVLVKDLHERFKQCGGNPIFVRDLECPVFDENVTEILESVWKAYAPRSEFTLSRAIRSHSAWRQAQRSFELEAVILPETIRETFKELAQRYANVYT